MKILVLKLTSIKASQKIIAKTICTTLTLPAELLEQTDLAVEQGKAKSRNEFIAQALRRELAAHKRAEIDAALAEMASNPEYQAEVLRMEAEFACTQC